MTGNSVVSESTYNEHLSYFSIFYLLCINIVFIAFRWQCMCLRYIQVVEMVYVVDDVIILSIPVLPSFSFCLLLYLYCPVNVNRLIANSTLYNFFLLLFLLLPLPRFPLFSSLYIPSSIPLLCLISSSLHLPLHNRLCRTIQAGPLVVTAARVTHNRTQPV